MNAKRYTFVAPVEIPTLRDGRTGFLDVVVTESGSFALRWRNLEDWPRIGQVSTGMIGRLVLTVTNDVLNLPARGKVTLTFEECIAVDDGQTLSMTWDENDWKLLD